MFFFSSMSRYVYCDSYVRGYNRQKIVPTDRTFSLCAGTISKLVLAYSINESTEVKTLGIIRIQLSMF